jgi:pSer/pThr/pTyr-binding forkhead associated (FHA) protein
MNLRLLVRAPGDLEGHVVPVPHLPFFIGRDPTCHLLLTDPYVSKRHCVVVERDDKLFIQDLKSMNGTFVNDIQVRGEREISDGDRVRLGQVLITVHLGTRSGLASKSEAVRKSSAPRRQQPGEL